MNKIVMMLVAATAAGVAGCAGDAAEETGSTDEAFTTGQRITCESSGYRYNSCNVNGRIRYARIARQLSSAACDQNTSWGYANDYVWVDRGCRAEFDVTLENGGNPGGRRIRVSAATYGANFGAQWGNATWSVQRQCDGRSTCDYYVNVSELGDPAYGRPKDFEVRYSCNDGQERRVYIAGEANGQRAYLSCDGWNPPPPPPPPPPPGGCGVLRRGQSLYQNQGVRSCNGRAYFVHQGDGNIVLYDGNRVLAASNIIDRSSSTLTLQDDGDLVQHARDGRRMWASNTAGHYGVELRVQDDCNVVIYDRGQAIWHTNTAGCVPEHWH